MASCRSGRRYVVLVVLCVVGGAFSDGNEGEPGGREGVGAEEGSCSRIQVYSSSHEEVERFAVSLPPKTHGRLSMEGPLDWQMREPQAGTAWGEDEEEGAAAREKGRQAFNISSFFSLLSTQNLGHIMLYNATLSSTQTLLYEDLNLEHDGVLVVADRQSNARGRGNNSWDSPEGCLVFSFTFRARASLLPFSQYVVAMAIYKAVSRLAGGDAKEVLGLQLKWPNDIYGPNRRKIGGILCQSSGLPGGIFQVVAGVGLNVYNAHPTTSLLELFQEASLPSPLSLPLSRESVLAAFCAEFEAMLSTLEREGFGPSLAAEYTRMWMHTHQRVEVHASDGSDPRSALIQRISNSGYLLAVDAQGRELELHPDGNSLDMMRGLIFQKK